MSYIGHSIQKHQQTMKLTNEKVNMWTSCWNSAFIKLPKCLLTQRFNKQVDAIDPKHAHCLFNLHAVNSAVITEEGLVLLSITSHYTLSRSTSTSTFLSLHK